jgi:hypothetical protein
MKSATGNLTTHYDEGGLLNPWTGASGGRAIAGNPREPVPSLTLSPFSQGNQILVPFLLEIRYDDQERPIHRVRKGHPWLQKS